jgi:hypothetical protein
MFVACERVDVKNLRAAERVTEGLRFLEGKLKLKEKRVKNAGGRPLKLV